MKVARAPFLALVAGMAGSHVACSSDDKATASGTPVTLDGGVLLPGSTSTATTCNDDDGFLPSCDSINGPAELGCDQPECERLLRSLKSHLATAAVACMQQHIATGDSCRGCSALALATSCPDPVSENACEQLRAKCPGKAFEDCITDISGLTFGGRLELIECTTESSCAKDIPSCLP